MNRRGDLSTSKMKSEKFEISNWLSPLFWCSFIHWIEQFIPFWRDEGKHTARQHLWSLLCCMGNKNKIKEKKNFLLFFCRCWWDDSWPLVNLNSLSLSLFIVVFVYITYIGMEKVIEFIFRHFHHVICWRSLAVLSTFPHETICRCEFRSMFALFTTMCISHSLHSCARLLNFTECWSYNYGIAE
jgi:hypothetical protein